jgi:hypothetical protein
MFLQARAYSPLGRCGRSAPTQASAVISLVETSRSGVRDWGHGFQKPAASQNCWLSASTSIPGATRKIGTPCPSGSIVNTVASSLPSVLDHAFAIAASVGARLERCGGKTFRVQTPDRCRRHIAWLPAIHRRDRRNCHPGALQWAEWRPSPDGFARPRYCDSVVGRSILRSKLFRSVR